MYLLTLKVFHQNFLMPTLPYHNHDKFEIFAFAELVNEDMSFSRI